MYCCFLCQYKWFNPEGFQSLMALIGTNGQGIGTRYRLIIIFLLFFFISFYLVLFIRIAK